MTPEKVCSSIQNWFRSGSITSSWASDPIELIRGDIFLIQRPYSFDDFYFAITTHMGKDRRCLYV